MRKHLQCTDPTGDAGDQIDLYPGLQVVVTRINTGRYYARVAVPLGMRKASNSMSFILCIPILCIPGADRFIAHMYLRNRTLLR